tara:strand:- start:4023 stop:4697 length:675 start_codon:yes stop_codon:yes gene_type:complete
MQKKTIFILSVGFILLFSLVIFNNKNQIAVDVNVDSNSKKNIYVPSDKISKNRPFSKSKNKKSSQITKILKKINSNPELKKLLDLYSRTNNKIVDEYLDELEREQEIYLIDNALTKGQLISEGLDPDIDELRAYDDNDPVINIGFMDTYDVEKEGDPIDEDFNVQLEDGVSQKINIESSDNLYKNEAVDMDSGEVADLLDELELRFRISEALLNKREIPFGEEI